MKRRTFLKGTAATAGTAGLAGCSSLPFFGDDGGGAGAGIDYLPAPGEIADNLDRYSPTLTSPAAVESRQDAIGASNWNSYRNNWARVRYAVPLASDLELAVRAGPFLVYEGSFRPERISTNLENDEFNDDGGEFEDNYQYYVDESGSQAYAFNDSTFISATLPAQANPDTVDVIDIVDAVLGANEGETDRYVEENDSLSVVADNAGSGEHINYQLFDPTRYDGIVESENRQLTPEDGQFEGHVATGTARSISGAETDLTVVLGFDDAEPDKDDIEDYVQEGSRFQNWREIDFQVDGNAAIIEGAVRSLDVWG